MTPTPSRQTAAGQKVHGISLHLHSAAFGESTAGALPTGVMIGDSWKADILGAAQAGIRALWLNRTGITCPDPKLAVEFRSFEPLTEMLALIDRH